MPRLAAVLLLAAGFACAPAADPPSSKEVAAAVKPFLDKHKLAGAVTLVADKDKVLAADAVGSADLAAKRPMTPDALFWIASMTKPMTAAAVMMLVDEGKVKLDDPVAKYLPEFKDLWVAVERDDAHVLLKRPKRTVTVRDVLSHMSGMPRNSPVESPPPFDTLPLRDRCRAYALTPLQSEPGEKYQYSSGINVAGRVVEVVGGKPFAEFLDARLLDPLGMADTTFWPTEAQAKRLATAYKWSADETGLDAATIPQLTHPLTDRHARHPLPSGGLFSTAADCATFCRMVLNGGTLNGKRYLSEAAVKEMTRRQTPDTVKESYGLGWMVGSGFFGHGGAFGTNMTVDPGRGLVTVFLVQHAGPGGGMRDAQAAARAAALKQFGGK
jgi:CubicO group peptidase (beta-lactamase class C family)